MFFPRLGLAQETEGVLPGQRILQRTDGTQGRVPASGGSQHYVMLKPKLHHQRAEAAGHAQALLPSP